MIPERARLYSLYDHSHINVLSRHNLTGLPKGHKLPNGTTVEGALVIKSCIHAPLSRTVGAMIVLSRTIFQDYQALLYLPLGSI